MNQPKLTVRFLSPRNPKFKKLEKSLARNLQTFNNRMAGPSRMKLLGLVARDKKGKIVGGLKGETFRDWLHIGLLWVDRRYRKKGLGRWLMNEAERMALRRKCRNSCVETGNSQAPGFYPRLGYRRLGIWTMSPKIQAYYFMKKLPKTLPAPGGAMGKGFRIESLPDKKKLMKVAKKIAKKLFLYTANKVGAPRRKLMALEMRDPQGRLVGGLAGDAMWNACMVDILWVHPALRDQGLGRLLLQTAEKKAMRWGCDQAALLANDFNGLGFFKKAGFRPFAGYPNMPKGHTRFIMKKKLRRMV